MCSKETEKAAIIRSLIFMQNQSCSKRMMDLLFVEKLAAKPRVNAERLYKEGMRSVQTETREDEMTQKVEPEEPFLARGLWRLICKGRPTGFRV